MQRPAKQASVVGMNRASLCFRMTATNHDLPNPDYAGHNRANSEERPPLSRHSLRPGIDLSKAKCDFGEL